MYGSFYMITMSPIRIAGTHRFFKIAADTFQPVEDLAFEIESKISDSHQLYGIEKVYTRSAVEHEEFFGGINYILAGRSTETAIAEMMAAGTITGEVKPNG